MKTDDQKEISKISTQKMKQEESKVNEESISIKENLGGLNNEEESKNIEEENNINNIEIPNLEEEKKDESAPADAQTAAETRPQPEAGTDARPKAPAAVAAPVQQKIVLEIWDTEHKTKIAFYKNGTYEAFYENGTTGSGKYILEDGNIYLVSDGEDQTTMIKEAASQKREKGIFYEFSLDLRNGTEYLFELKMEDMALLNSYCVKDI